MPDGGRAAPECHKSRQVHDLRIREDPKLQKSRISRAIQASECRDENRCHLYHLVLRARILRSKAGLGSAVSARLARDLVVVPVAPILLQMRALEGRFQPNCGRPPSDFGHISPTP